MKLLLPRCKLAAQNQFHNDSPDPQSAAIKLAKEDGMESGAIRNTSARLC